MPPTVLPRLVVSGCLVVAFGCASGGAPAPISIAATPTVFVARIETALWTEREVRDSSEFRKIDYGVRALVVERIGADSKADSSFSLSANAAGYVVAALPPGRYEITGAHWGDKKSVCKWACITLSVPDAMGYRFNERVSRFETVSGRVNYAGTVVLVDQERSTSKQVWNGTETTVATQARIDQLWDVEGMLRDLSLGAGEAARVNRATFIKVAARPAKP